MTTTHYSFEFGGCNAGYYVIEEEIGRIAMKAVFRMEEEVFENVFELRLQEGQLTHFRANEGPWVDMAQFPADHYPTSAYPLLLRGLRDQRTYVAIHEGDRTPIGQTVLTRDGDIVTETRHGNTVRIFTLDGDAVESIDWGGPVSHRRPTLVEAIAGSTLPLPS